MIKRLCIFLFLVSPAFGDGPKYSFPDPKLNDEVGNIYHDLKYPNIVIGRASTMTVVQLNVSSITISGSISGAIPQSSTNTIILSTATTVSASFVSSGLSKSITPRKASNKVLVMFSGTLRTSNASACQSELAMFRDSTNICAGGTNSRGCVYVTMGAGTDSLDVPASFAILDSPNTTSSVTYTLYFRCDGSGTATIDNQSTQNGIILIEVAS